MMHPDVQELVALLDEAEALLRRYGETLWADWLQKDAQSIREGDFYGVEHLLRAFGGMGSFNDCYITRTLLSENA